MADLEAAADVAVGKVAEIESGIAKLRAALATTGQRLAQAREGADGEWGELEERARVMLQSVDAHAAQLGEEAEAAREACVELDGALAGGVSEWRGELAAASAGVTALATHVGGGEAPLAEGADAALAATRELGERAAAIEVELRQALDEARVFLQDELTGELREMQEALRARAAEMAEAIAHGYEEALEAAVADWEERLQQVEEVLDVEFASAREHAAEVVEFSLAQCRQAHEETGDELVSAAEALDGTLQQLAQSIVEREGEVAEVGSAVEASLAAAAGRVEEMSGVLRRELETMARYEFVDA